ncbi:hypothetical protein GGP50_000013 [Salinibacter ruber]|jgi:hypothetical protein|uniref:hypothetical protein n=1 Tax=Salinibacter ruber TaxID=146919 RepID=UPI00207481EB|nr:hypothetical protein [Salinibacter ruber]MCS3666210.1 hypothetical protein [Salinibacter ruber]MCS4191825.1 hypothetical protein [Salinibacter ruber]
MAHAFFLGVDVSPADGDGAPDVTHALFEKSKEDSDEPATYRLNRIRDHADVASADDLADHFQGLVADQPYIGRTSLIVNRGADFGAALVGALEDRGMDPVAATLTSGGGAVAGDPDEIGVHLGGGDVLRRFVNLHRDGRLRLENHATEAASRLARDVQALSERLDEIDGDMEALGETQTDGLSFDPAATHITSAALAVWLGSERSFDPSQRLKTSPQTDAGA